MIEPSDLARLEGDVLHALEVGRDEGLHVIGYGEVTLVLGWPAGAPVVACKRLPPFRDRATCDRYEKVLVEYVGALRDRGVDVVDTELHSVEHADGTVAGYAVQPALDPGTLGPVVLRAADPAAGHPMVEAVFDATLGVLGPHLGLDAQLSNWVWDGERLRYLDVTTPFVWADDGAPQLDLRVLTTALPWMFRGLVRRFVAPGIMDTYRDPRSTLRDFCGNLVKERLDWWLAPAIAAANRRVSPPLGEREVRKAYDADARLWEVIMRLRRFDRSWQRHVRRRPYPFLLPGPIQRY